MKKVYMFLADGFEETEAVTPWDLLLRAGADVKTVSITESRTVKGAHGLTVAADITANEFELDFDMIILPGGGMGTENLGKSETVKKALEKAIRENLYIGAICAAPTVLGKYGLLDNKNCTCFPGCESGLGKAIYHDGEKVVKDGKIITCTGMGASADFGFALAEILFGKEKADKLRITTRFTV